MTDNLIKQYQKEGTVNMSTEAKLLLIRSLFNEVEKLRAAQQKINDWCQAYPESVFIELTTERWGRAHEVLSTADDCPSLAAISGSNMRFVVQGIARLIKDN